MKFTMRDCSREDDAAGLIGFCWQVIGPRGPVTEVSWSDYVASPGVVGVSKESRVVAQTLVDHLNNPWSYEAQLEKDRLADARLVESARDIRWRERIEELAQKWEYNYPQMAAELRRLLDPKEGE